MTRVARWLLVPFVASIPLEDVVTIAAFGRVSRVLGVLALLAWLASVVITGRTRKLSAAAGVATCFLAWAALSYFWSDDQMHTALKVFTLAQLFTIIVIVWDLVRTQEHVVHLMRAIVIGGIGASLMTIDAARHNEATEGTARFAATNAGPNYTGCVLVVTLALTWYLWRTDDVRSFRVVYVASVVLGVVGVLLTASRTALVALLLVGVITLFDRRNLRLRRLAIIGIGTAVLVTISLALVPAESIERLSTTNSELSSGTLNSRTTYWEVAWQLLGDHPVVGVGSNMFERSALDVTGREVVAHNMFISTAAELGLIGLALLLALLATIVSAIVTSVPARALRSWLAIGVAWLVGASALTWETRKITWCLAAIAIAASGTIGGRARSGAPANRSPAATPDGRATITARR